MGTFFGSGALPDKMLYLGLLKISQDIFFFLFLVPAGPNPNSLPNPAGLIKHLLNLT